MDIRDAAREDRVSSYDTRRSSVYEVDFKSNDEYIRESIDLKLSISSQGTSMHGSQKTVIGIELARDSLCTGSFSESEDGSPRPTHKSFPMNFNFRNDI